MAFCTNCGKSLEEGARFCTNCGTAAQVSTPAPAMPLSAPVAAAPAPAPVADPPVAAYEIQQRLGEVSAERPFSVAETPASTAYDDFAPAPQSSMSPVFMIVCVVLLLLIAGGIGGTVYFQRQGKAKAAAQQALTETSQPCETPPSNASAAASVPANSSPATPAPTATVPAVAPAAVPVADSIRAMNLGNYPGATPVAIATLTGETVVAGFLTRDTPHQVMQFYRVRFPVATTNESEGKAELSATLPGGERIRIQAQPQGSNTQVMVLQER